MPYNRYPFELPPLSFAYEALEPYIDKETMKIHHDGHFKTYIDKLNKAIEPYPYLHRLTLSQILSRKRALPAESSMDILQNGGGVYNHSLFFSSLAPVEKGNHYPGGIIEQSIKKCFGSFEDFRHIFSERALSVFGSGWTYLLLTPNKNLRIVNYRNQDTPVCENGVPIMAFDLWEHAYYIKYKNKRSDYIKALWNVITFSDCENISKKL